MSDVTIDPIAEGTVAVACTGLPLAPRSIHSRLRGGLGASAVCILKA